MQHEPASAALAGQRLVVVDVEGNGQRPPEIVELAVVTIEEGVLATPRSWLVKPERPITPLLTRRVHGISNGDVANAPPFAAIRDDVQALLADAWFVAHNAGVERGILTPQLPGWTPRGVLDTLRLARRLWPGRPRYGLDALIEQERLDLSSVATTSQRHRAAYDAYATALLLLRLVDSLGDAEHPLEQLAKLAAPTSTSVPARRGRGGGEESQQEHLWTPPDRSP